MAKIGPIKQLKPGEGVNLTPEFWQFLANLPKFKKTGIFTELTA